MTESTPPVAEAIDDAPDDRRYTPAPNEPQLTFRAVAAGCLIGGVVSCTNIYIGLKIGWTFGASIISAVLAFALFSAFKKNLSVLETNITQTAGSAAGSMASAAGLVAAIPALTLLRDEGVILDANLQWYNLMLWALATAFLGVFFAVPLRRQMVEVDKLRFPTGMATTETILAMVSEAGEAIAKARVLIIAGLLAGGFKLLTYFIPEIEEPLQPFLPDPATVTEWSVVGALAIASQWTFLLSVSPSLMGAGFLIGPRVSFSLLAGAIIAWGILGPWVQSQGWAPGKVMEYEDGPRGWLLWPGVALMVAEALTALALSWRTFIRAFQFTSGGTSDVDMADRIPNSWWIGGLLLGSISTMTIAYFVFDIAPWMTAIAIALSSVLAIVAVRSTGETDINPVGGMGKVTQLVYGGLAPGQIGTNLMCAAITGAGASQASDMMQDLKTGYLLRAAPRKQFIAQLIGVCAGVVFVVPVYYLYAGAYEIGGEKLPAPAAAAWKAMAQLLAKGFSALPEKAPEAVMIAGAVGVLLPILRRSSRLRPYIPSGLAMGIAFIVPAFNSLIICMGTIVWLAWKKISPQAVANYDFALASGLVAGEGLLGIVHAGLTMGDVPNLWQMLEMLK